MPSDIGNVPSRHRIDNEFGVDAVDGEYENALAEIERLVNKFHHNENTGFGFTDKTPKTYAHALQE